ncbi:hypothetical protein [Rubellimicrobium thermophilum]|uniref:hypothetical protein n=1 Tax=Rubellimicrobium thermophilum TaxID=295419 RepID=UPI0003FCA363|nr:hypothetical protein [Rubellimicrobium thermophilum]
MPREPRERLLQARLRSLLRAREAQFDLAPAVTGLAEGASPFEAAPTGRIAVIAASSSAMAPHAALPDLAARLGCMEATDDRDSGPDLAVLDAHAIRGDLEEGAQVLEHLAALRARAAGAMPRHWSFCPRRPCRRLRSRSIWGPTMWSRPASPGTR